MTTSTTKKLTIATLAALTLAIGSLAMTGDAMAKGKHGGKGWHGGHGVHKTWRGHRRHRWHGHRWHGRYFVFGAPYYTYGEECYFVRKKYSRKLIKICPDYYRY